MIRWLFVLLVTIFLSAGCSCSDDDDDDNDDAAVGDDDEDDDSDDDNDIDDDDDEVDDDTTDDDIVDDDTSNVDCTQTVERGDLEWSICDNGEDITHGDAVTYVEQLELGGHDDWRLPSWKELRELYDESREIDTDCYIPAHIVDPFVISCVWAWGAETVVLSGEEMAMRFGFSHGSASLWGSDDGRDSRVLAVRDMTK